MIEKIGHIKNPLTIIAMFAGIAEISGTIILPFISDANQSRYVWFLICFPALLVLIFFITLWFKPKVLYAPSDYTDEKNFVRMMEPASFSEVEAKIQREAAELFSIAPDSDEDVSDPPSAVATPPDSKSPAASSRRNKTFLSRRDVEASYALGERRALAVLATEFPNLVTNVAIASSKGRRVFDGVAQFGDSKTFFEVKVLDYVNKSYIIESADKFASAVSIVMDDKTRWVRLILVIAIKDAAKAQAKLDLHKVQAGNYVVEIRFIEAE